MAFKAEELTIQIFPASNGLWACPESTIKGQPCGDTKRPCSQGTIPPGGGGGCAQDSRKPPKKETARLDRDALALLQGQLRDRLTQGPVTAGL